MTNQERARELWQRTRDEHFAVGAFNVDNQETLIAICRAAQAKQAPVLVEVSQGEVDAIGLSNIRDLVDNYKQEMGLEMYINLDHSPSVEAAKAGIDAGFEFIHIDVSQANHEATDEEIIAATQEVVNYAKKTGALVESEPHYFGVAPTFILRRSTTMRSARPSRRRREPRLSFKRPGSIPLLPPSVIFMASIPFQRSLILIYCVRSGVSSIALLAYMVARIPLATTLSRRPRLVSARSISTPICVMRIAPS